jgi:UDP-N-acetylmuramoyl-L-alanyl-D-glutamate--2,6-diaminopimelate ligase
MDIMNFDTLLLKSGIPVLARNGIAAGEIGDIAVDSRTTKPGDLFIAIPGTRLDGTGYIADAISRGAAAIVGEKPLWPLEAPYAQVANARSAAGRLGAALWSVSTDTIESTGITGTNGKTTIAHLFRAFYEKRFGAEMVWMFGTIDYTLGGLRTMATHTTPESVEIFRLLAGAPSLPRALVMEVSSHSLALDRISGLAFDCAVFTNLTQDHLDFHGTMEKYYLAKKRLFTDFMKKGGRRVINIDNAWGRRLAGEIGPENVVTYGKAADADVRIVNFSCGWEGTSVQLLDNRERIDFSSTLRGTFNVYNMAAFYAAVRSEDRGLIAAAFAEVGTVAGRMEVVPLAAPFTVVVDYAHTPDALTNILQAARPMTEGRILCVFGCGGDRDRTKRPLMGRAVADGADEAIVTSDNPRSEDPRAIISEILAGMPLDFPHRVIADRKEAIRTALLLAKPGDCLIIAGKGHETYQEIAGVRHPFDDRNIAAALWNGMKPHA